MQALTSGDGNLVHGAMRVLTGTMFVTFAGSKTTNKLFIKLNSFYFHNVANSKWSSKSLDPSTILPMLQCRNCKEIP